LDDGSQVVKHTADFVIKVTPFEDYLIIDMTKVEKNALAQDTLAQIEIVHVTVPEEVK
jgi:hypothetical protein